MAESPDFLNSAKVKDLIFAYERQVSHTDPLEDYYYEGRQRAKSIGNALSYKNFREPELKINNILDIEKELVKIEAHLNYYEVYEKDTHVAFQEQLFGVLTNIVSIDPEGHESTIQKKRELIGETQKLATILNLKLPTDGSHSYRGGRRTYSTATRREESLHSSISLRSKEHRVTSNTSHAVINSGFQSEESLTSTKDSIECISKQEDEDDWKKSEDGAENKQKAPEEEPKRSTTVSKLKRFFSFKRDEKPAIHVTAAAYSGVTRSQSLHVKTSRYVATKRDKTEEQKQREKIISESEEGNEDDNFTQGDKTIESSVDPSLYVETAKDIEDYRDVQTANSRNISVSKLKSLFEDSRKESGEGLALLTKNPNVYGSAYDLNLPNAQTNFSPFRLTRTISGTYMNFVGLLRNVDIEKKGDLNKSKSLSDLKVASLSYPPNGNVSQVDLSQELDGDDDNDDFHQEAIEVGRESPKSANTSVKIEQTLETVKGSEQQETRFSEVISGGNVELLKKAFEDNKNEEHKQDTRYVVNGATIKPVLYSEDSQVASELRNNEDTILNQTPVTLQNLEDNHIIGDHQKSVDVLVKGKVEILKKAFDGTDKDLLNTNNIEKLESKHVVSLRTQNSASTTEMKQEHLSTSTIKNVIEPVEYDFADGAPEIVEDAIQSTTGADSQKTSNDQVAIEPVLYKISLTEESSVKDLARHGAAITQIETLTEDNDQNKTNNLTVEGSTEIIDNQNEDKHAKMSKTEEVDETKSKPASSKGKTLQLPVDLRIANYEELNDATVAEKSPPIVPITVYNGGELTIVNAKSETTEVAQSGFQSKTDSFMKILDSPSVRLTAGASYFESQNNSSSKTSVSYSEKKTVQHTSTQVSQRIESSSSTQLSSMNYLEALKEPNSYSIITSSNPNDEDSVEIVELADSPKELSKSQDTILDEILKNGETIQNVDEEFEKLLQDN